MFFKKWFKRKEDWEKAGFYSKASYERWIDPDISIYASDISSFYHGYPYTFPLESEGLRDYGLSGPLPYSDLADEMKKWCEENCRGKWRNDWHRGFWNPQGNYEFNGIGGGDMMFFAFQDEQDSIMFRLRW